MLFSLAQFVMASPFLRIKPLFLQIKKIKNPNEIYKLMKIMTFSKTIPFDFILNMRKTDIIIPIDHENELQIHISSKLIITSTDLTVNLKSMTLNLYDHINKMISPSIISNLTANFSIKIEEDSSLALQANIHDVNMHFSIRDVYYIILLINSVKETLNSQIFAFEKANIDIYKLGISSFDITSAKMVFVLCKNTQSISENIPIFRATIPSITFKVQKSKGIAQNPVEINIKPFIEYFNTVTGNFDLIIEPINMKIFAYIIDEQIAFGIDTSDIYFNFSLNAIAEIHELVNNVDQCLKNKASKKYEELSVIWLCNKLGSKVDFVIGEKKYAIEHDDFVPLEKVLNNIIISFSIDDSKYTIESNSFNYPTYLSQKILVIKKPYKGGMMICFERTFQIENKLNFAVDLYVCDNVTKEYCFVSVINPHERQPLLFDKEVIVSFQKKGETKNIKTNSFLLHMLDKLQSKFQIICDNKKRIQCIKTVYNDTNIAARIVSINSQYLIYNLLPLALFYKSDDEEITFVKRGDKNDFYYIQDDTFSSYLSFDDKKFLKHKSISKINFKSTSSIDIYNPDDTFKQKCMIEFSYEKETEQTTIILYMPVVIFNTTLFYFDFEVQSMINNENAIKKCNYTNHLNVMPKSSQYWCPPALLTNSDEDSLNIVISEHGNTKLHSKPFDCLTTGNTTIYLPSLIDENLFIPLRCNIFNQSRTSILTLSPLVTIINNLDVKFKLTPIKNIPTNVTEKIILNNVEGETDICEKFSSPLEFTPHSNIMLPYIPLEGTVSISVDGFCTSPSLILLEPQKTVFKIQNQNNYILIELVVIDLET